MQPLIEYQSPGLTVGLGFASLLYLALAVRVARASSGPSNGAISGFLFLIGLLVAGSAFSYGAVNANLYGVGRTFSMFSAGFIPLVFYIIYRDFTVGRPSIPVLAALAVIPVASMILAATNPLHHFVWTIEETSLGVRFTDVNEHLWFRRVHAPYAYGLFGYCVIALASWLPTIARAHRREVLLLLICAVLPFTISVSNTLLGFGPPEFPFTSVAFVLMLPLYAWATLGLKVYEFSPLVYQTMFDHVRDPIFVLDKSLRVISANRPAERLLESAEKDLVGERLWEDLPEAQAIFDRAKNGDLTQTIRMQSDRYFELNASPLKGPTGHDQGMVVVCRDVTLRNKALAALKDSEHLIRSLVEHSSNGILRFSREVAADGGYECEFANRAAELYLGCEEGSLIGRCIADFDALEPRQLLAKLNARRTPTKSVSYEVSIETGPESRWLRIVGEPVGCDFSVTLIDITQRKLEEDRILADAIRDPLTGVLNRRGFEQEAGGRLSQAEQGAVIYLDLNAFKSVNDRYGHPAGDALLKAFGHRLEFCLRSEDVLGRLGGDEFAIVLPGVTVEDVRHIAERLVETACQAYIIQGLEIVCTASVGIALLPKHGKDLWHLVSIADQAMYNVKTQEDQRESDDHAAYVAAAVAS